MAEVEKTIKVNVDVVVSQAKQALGDISTSINKAGQTLDTLSKSGKKSLDAVTDSTNNARGSVSKFFDDTTSGVIKGLASYDLFRKGVGTAFDFLKSSFNASLAASEAMAQVSNNVKNAGLSYDQIAPKLKDYSEKMIQLGFDDEDTALSVSKLALVTGDYNQAIKLNQLAMDLARNKSIDLATATNLVTQVTQGHGRVLQQYGIELDDTASAADNLSKLQLKVGDSAKIAAETPGGKIRTLQVQWQNMQETVGDALVPAMDDLFKTLQENLPAIEELGKGVATFVGWAGKAVGAITGFASDAGFFLGNVVNKIQGLPTVTKDATKATDDLADSGKELAKTFDGVGVSSKASDKAIQDQQNSLDQLAQTVSDVTGKMNQFSFESTDDFIRFGKVLADTKMKQEEWTKTVGQGFDAFSAKIKSVNGDVDTLKGKLEDAKKSYQDFLTSTAKDSGDSFAQIVHDAEKAIPTLQKQIADAQAGGSDTTDLQKQLAEKQSIISSAQQAQYQSNTEFVTQLAFLRSQDGKNELDQAYAVMQQKIDAKKKETDEAVAQIQKQIDAATAERDKFVEAQTAMTLAFQQNVANRSKSANTEIASLASLESAINSVADAYARLNASKSGSVSTTATKARAAGGPVSSGESYLVGENGPEMFTPNVSGSITPNSKVSAMSGTVININYPTVRSDSDLRDIVAGVEDALSRRDELARMGAYK